MDSSQIQTPVHKVSSEFVDRAADIIITNPNMDPTKYSAAIDLMADKFGLPDFAYRVKVVSRQEKDAARDLIDMIYLRSLKYVRN